MPGEGAEEVDDAALLLTVNTGSSSVKAALYRAPLPDRPVRQLSHDRIPSGSRDDFRRALDDVAGWATSTRGSAPVAVGHRVVHGGLSYARPQKISPDLIAELQRLVAMDPQHLPQAIMAIEAMRETFPNAVEVACFDTAFHRTMPQVAQVYALPRHLADEGVLRYGFHGLSYESIVTQLRARGPLPPRLVVAHLGNGSSMAAILNGESVDTTMGFTPTGGLVMGTRSGDIDPGVALYLVQSKGMSGAQLNELFNRESGLVGLSGTTGDMRDLLAASANDPRAALAVEVYSYCARKFLAAMASVLGGLDALVFTGGIGEHSSEIRERVCRDLRFMGIQLERGANRVGAAVVSAPGSIPVHVMHTDEDGMIARHTAAVLSGREE